MQHIKHVTKTCPAQAESLLVWTQKAAVLGTLATAFNTYTQGAERKTADE